MEPSVICASK